MDHIAIMKKSWGLLPKIISGEKKVESRWYKSKIVPWDRIRKGDSLYFKDSGELVTLKSKVIKVIQYEARNNQHALEIFKKHAFDLGLKNPPTEISQYIKNKKYAIFVFFDSVEKIKPFKIDKSGFGLMAAWITVGDIRTIKNLPNL